jgi:hypothetical protein
MESFISIVAAAINAASRIELRALVMAATGRHLATTAAVLVIGRFSLMPSQFGSTGLGEFAWDGYVYQLDVDT